VEEATKIMAADHPLASLWTVALATGMRMSELLHLDWADVDLGRGRIRVRGTKTSDSDATVLLAPFAVAALRAHRAAAGRVGGYVWATRSGSAHLRSNMQRYWRAQLEDLGIPYVNFHYATRHTCATLLRAEGVPMHVIQSVLRHARITTTAGTYAHADIEEQRLATDALERVFGR
jgi:integrase